MEFDLRIDMNLFVLLPYFPTDYDNHGWKTLCGLLHGYCFGGLDLGCFNCNKLCYWCKCFSCLFIFFHVLQSSLLHTFFWVFEPWINSIIKKKKKNLAFDSGLVVTSKRNRVKAFLLKWGRILWLSGTIVVRFNFISLHSSSLLLNLLLPYSDWSLLLWQDLLLLINL